MGHIQGEIREVKRTLFREFFGRVIEHFPKEIEPLQIGERTPTDPKPHQEASDPARRCVAVPGKAITALSPMHTPSSCPQYPSSTLNNSVERVDFIVKHECCVMKL